MSLTVNSGEKTVTLSKHKSARHEFSSNYRCLSTADKDKTHVLTLLTQPNRDPEYQESSHAVSAVLFFLILLSFPRSVKAGKNRTSEYRMSSKNVYLFRKSRTKLLEAGRGDWRDEIFIQTWDNMGAHFQTVCPRGHS